jgi:hypothetical protein
MLILLTTPFALANSYMTMYCWLLRFAELHFTPRTRHATERSERRSSRA